jgi:hypothetical protein
MTLVYDNVLLLWCACTHFKSPDRVHMSCMFEKSLGALNILSHLQCTSILLLGGCSGRWFYLPRSLLCCIFLPPWNPLLLSNATETLPELWCHIQLKGVQIYNCRNGLLYKFHCKRRFEDWILSMSISPFEFTIYHFVNFTQMSILIICMCIYHATASLS